MDEDMTGRRRRKEDQTSEEEQEKGRGRGNDEEVFDMKGGRGREEGEGMMERGTRGGGGEPVTWETVTTATKLLTPVLLPRLFPSALIRQAEVCSSSIRAEFNTISWWLIVTYWSTALITERLPASDLNRQKHQTAQVTHLDTFFFCGLFPRLLDVWLPVNTQTVNRELLICIKLNSDSQTHKQSVYTYIYYIIIQTVSWIRSVVKAAITEYLILINKYKCSTLSFYSCSSEAVKRTNVNIVSYVYITSLIFES